MQVMSYDWNLPAVSDEVLKNSNVLIISMAGSARTLKAAPWPVCDLEDVKAMDELDYVGSIAHEFKNSGKNKIVSLSKDPYFSIGDGIVGSGWITDENYFLPDEYDLASEIRNIANKMQPDRKIILIGKSMGACKLMNAARQLYSYTEESYGSNTAESYGVVIDLLILVDASCMPERHDNEYMDIPPNVKRVISFYQRSGGEKQTGYPVSNNFIDGRVNIILYDPETGNLRAGHPIFNNLDRKNIDVNECGMCNNVGHNTIDTCASLITKTKTIVRNELKMYLANIINILLN